MINYLRTANLARLGATALVRLDFNTQDKWRIQATLPTLRLLFQKDKKIIIVSHRGRPKHQQANLSLRPDAVFLSKALKRKVVFIPHFRFAEIKRRVAQAAAGAVFLLENIRFLKSETTARPELARRLAALANFYVNDAFAVDHRATDSVAKLERFLPSYAGLELEKEMKFLSGVMNKPVKPLLVILGGSKAQDKLGVLRHFRHTADYFLLGGAAANTLAYLKGEDVGASLLDRDVADLRRLKILLKYKNIILPVDYQWRHGAILDIGPRTEKLFARKIKMARTILWSGPMGLIEEKLYARGTLAVARAIVKNRRAFAVTGGGETVAFLKKRQLDKKFSFLSTGGGAMLDYLAGKKLPGIEALRKSKI